MAEPVFDFSTFLSPFTWRYGSPAMRHLWSQEHQRRLWRQVWLALAEAQMEAGLLQPEHVADLRAHVEAVDLVRAHAIEAEIRHDLMAELKTYAEQCPEGGRYLHLGATSADVQDNADAIRLRDALALILKTLHELLTVVADQIECWASTVTMGFTHLQPAEPTTVGYRMAVYGNDLLMDWHELIRVQSAIRGKGIKGAVGTGASYVELLKGTGWSLADLEARVMEKLGLDAFSVTTQVYPRKQDWLVLNALAGVAGSLHKMMFDVRVLQIPLFDEWAESFGARQVGSSAMPFKRNPIRAENIDSLARWVVSLTRQAWDNAALSLLERTLDDSANRRLILPSAFLAVDEILHTAVQVVRGLVINEDAIARHLDAYGTFAAVERLLMALGKAGADRQAMHERMRVYSMQAWAQVAAGANNPLPDLLSADEEVTRYVSAAEVRKLLNAHDHIGDAPERARALAAQIRDTIGAEPSA